MKVVNKRIDVVAWFDSEGIHPVRFRYKDNDKEHIIKINKVMYQYDEKFTGIILKVFRCRSKIDDLDKIYEIKYNTRDYSWILFKL